MVSSCVLTSTRLHFCPEEELWELTEMFEILKSLKAAYLSVYSSTPFPDTPGLYSPHSLCSRAHDIMAPLIDPLGAPNPTKNT